jgi:uncharacterized protein (DUF924 family)
VSRIATADAVLSFWFRDLGPDRWFAVDDALDATIGERFADTWALGAEGGLDGWSDSGEGAVALAILLDQFPRNMYRGTPAAFSTDAAARAVALSAIDAGRDRDPMLGAAHRLFLYLPLEHSESLDHQRLAVALITDRVGIPPYIDYARRHFDVIARFGRFPHRNAVLGRVSTEAEAAYLATPDAGF